MRRSAGRDAHGEDRHGGGAERVLAVSGLGAEARLARGAGVRVVAGGGDSAALAASIRRELERGARALISFGIAGGLAPSLRPGTLVVASAICMPDGTLIPTDLRWSQALQSAVPGALFGVLAGSETIVSEPRQKADLRARTAALAVDMESQTVARMAAAHGLPFTALRAIADSAERCLPAAATVAMRAGGGLDLRAVLRSLASEPAQVAGLLRIALDARAALAALARGRRLLGDRLGYTDLDHPFLDVV